VLLAQRGLLEPALLIAMFHTGFNLAGVLLLAPFTVPFTHFVERLVPDTAPGLTRHLDPSVAELPAVAVEAARRAVIDTCDIAIGVLHAALLDPRRGRLPLHSLDNATAALQQTRQFLTGVRSSTSAAEHDRHLSLHHAMDHLERLIERLQHHTPDRPATDSDFDELRLRAAALMPEVRQWLTATVDGAAAAGQAVPAPADLALTERCAALSSLVAGRRRTDREHTLALTASGELDPELASRNLAAMRWLDSALYHVWRTIHHLSVADPLAAAPAPMVPTPLAPDRA
jgi:phosphate:Na+ symporter